MTETYTRRSVPTGYDKGFLDLELQKIQRSLASKSGTNVVLAADVSNSASATNKATGLKTTVATGTTYLCRWTVFVSSNANTGGVQFKLTHPAYTASLLHVRYNSASSTTFADAEPAIGASPTTLATGVVAYSGTGLVVIEHRIVPSAAGSVELAFAPTLNTQNYTVQAGSLLEVFSA